ncbi:MAG: hypothetical protein QOI44_110 [Actinomycetota bacterium]|jgi:DNA-binding response OmpR family regulator|nr:hypothetical protein [Actinomycetota bacterium]
MSNNYPGVRSAPSAADAGTRPAMRLEGPDPMLTRTFSARAAQVGVPLPPLISSGRLSVDLEGYDALLDGDRVDLTALQVELLALFLAAPSRVWSREELTWVCWREPAEGRRVDVQLSRIRAKLGVDLFRNVRDRGWALRPVLYREVAAG